ncbi:60Kd inner membrane protein-domain-containing protein [Mycena capillaripes]|nr:60Kd inner membrane protein-domain-containing protein [Mycena capillaripes]
MLAVRIRPSLQRITRCPSARQPLNRRFFIQSLCDGFLDLAIALPFPPSVPSYSATIIVVTVASRLALFPVALWGRNRVRRLENVVLPEMERLKPIISKQILDDMKQQGMPKELLVPATLQRIHLSRLKEKVSSEQKRLITEHKCNPIVSMVASPASQLPVFIVMTMMFNRLAQDPTPLDSEAFFTLTTLNHPDSTWTLPIMLGLVTMANVDMNSWLMSAVQRDRLQKMEEKRAQQIAAGVKPGIQAHKIIKNALFLLSIGRIALAAITPGSVVLYWTTSAVCGLIQTWILDYTPTGKPTVQSAPPNAVPIQSLTATAKPPEPAINKKSAKKAKSKRRPW